MITQVFCECGEEKVFLVKRIGTLEGKGFGDIVVSVSKICV